MSLNFNVVSDSMLPVIKPGQKILIEKINDDIRIFDIILFERDDKLIVHFVWKNQINFNDTVITRSLKEYLINEEPVKIEKILGRVKNIKIPMVLKIKTVLFSILSGRL